MSKGYDTGNLLWDLAVIQANDKTNENTVSDDSAVFVIGGKGAGKTSIILRFLDRDEASKPTVALEYTFGRKAKGHNIAKDVGHIWELGGGTWLTKLMDVPLNPDTITHTALAIVVDLSKPNEIWFTLESLLAAAKSRIETIIAEMKPDFPNIKEELKKAAWKRVGEDHMDSTMMDPFLIPLIIIGGKYDIFQDFDSEKRKVICKTLRFIAHIHGASLQFFSIKQEQQVNKMRALISHHLFETSLSKTLQTEHNKPIQVAAGHDSLQQIGTPPLSDKDVGRINAKNPMQLWKHAYIAKFPQEASEDVTNPAMVDDPAKDPQYKEAAIDSLRAQKDEELERYRRMSERKAKSAKKYGETFAS
ncbi:cytoplasmic dynein 2 light intermediate chain 1-like isoform X1 [Pecten maximus]|uniref:cytoplasmic dynein 2 light intermediate chain 1-like isoform X1 n=1 Tax=Pecten maximus TaxID=6579 RepID=UPI001458F936|nr:cytoplasmic dynein 2 light intermediate chain 1-like isoform X1 [Pecten maximus]